MSHKTYLETKAAEKKERDEAAGIVAPDESKLAGETVPNRAIAESVSQMLHSEDEDQQKKARTVLDFAGSKLSDELRAEYGLPLQAESADTRNVFEKAMGSSPVRTALGVLGRPAQVAMRTLQGAGQAIGTAARPLIGKDADWDAVADTFGKVGQAVTDVEGKEDINARQMLFSDHGTEIAGHTLDKDYGGKVAGALDLAATIGLDPTTYLTGGASAAAKTTGKVVAEEVGEAAAKRFATEGGKDILTAAERTSVLDRLVADATEAGSRGPRSLGFRHQGVEAGAEKAMRALERNGRGGVVLGGRTVVSGDRLNKIGQTARLSDKVTDVARPTDEAFSAADSLLAADPDLSVLAATAPADEIPQLLDQHFAGAGADVSTEAQAAVRARLLPDTVDTLTRRGLKTKVKDSAGGWWLGDAFIPGYGVNRDLRYGKEGNEFLKVERSRADAAAGLKADEIQQTINNTAKAAGVTRHDVAAITAEMDKVGGREALVAKYAAEGNDEMAHYVSTLDEMSQATGVGRVEKGMLPEEFLHDAETFVPRVLTPEGKKALEKADRIGRSSPPGFAPNEAMSIANQGGVLNARTFMPNAPVANVNEAMDRLYGDLMPKNAKMYLEDSAAAIGNDAAHYARAASEQDFIRNVGAKLDTEGNPFLIHTLDDGVDHASAMAQAEKTWGKAGFEEVPAGSNGHVFAPKPIADDFKRAQELVIHDNAMKGFRKLAQQWQKLSKSYATVPVIFGSGFHARNATGNLFLNYLAGYTSIGLYKEASTIQRAASKAEKLVGTQGVKTFEDALRAGKLSERQVKLALDAKAEGVWGGGYFGQDLGKEFKIKGGRTTDNPALRAWEGTKRNANPLDTGNAVVRSGRKVGETVEENARLAHYIGAVDKLGDSKAASLSVKKYLFDYGDLTPFEQNNLKSVIGFYTFMRKNTALQVEQMIHNPGKFTKLAHVQDSMENTDSPLADAVPLPQYALRDGQTPLPDGLSKMLMGKDSGDPVLGSVDLPMNAAIDTLAPLVRGIAMAPGVKKYAPEFLKDPEGYAGVARGAFGSIGMGPVEAVKLAVEQGTGVSLYTGGPIPERGKMDNFIRLISPVIPLATKGDSTIDDLSGSGRSEGRNIWKPTLMKLIVGLNTTPVDDKAQSSERIRRQFELTEMLAAYNKDKAEGDKLPGIDELRERGIIPPAKKKKKKAKAATGGGGLTLDDVFG